MWHRGERPAGDPAWKENGPTALSSSRPARTRLPTSSLRHIHGRENVVRRFREFYSVFSHDFRRVLIDADPQGHLACCRERKGFVWERGLTKGMFRVGH